MSLELKGTIKVINETQTFDSGFQKREFVITTEGEYPQDVKFELTKERVQLLNVAKVGDAVNVAFNIRGNEYNGKYYVNLQAWKVDYNNGSAQIATEARQNAFIGNDTEGEDDLPF